MRYKNKLSAPIKFIEINLRADGLAQTRFHPKDVDLDQIGVAIASAVRTISRALQLNLKLDPSDAPRIQRHIADVINKDLGHDSPVRKTSMQDNINQ